MKYSKSLDLLITAAQFALQGNDEKAAKFFTTAMAQKDLKETLAGLDALQGKALAAVQTASPKAKTAPAAAGRVASFLAKKAGKQVKASDADIFNDTIDGMTSEEADIDDILELPEETAGDDNGQGESDLDVGNDDASDLDESPSLDLADLDDLRDLSDEDFGSEDFGEEANTTGEGDVETHDVICDPEDTPEGQPAKDLPPVPKPEDTTVVSSAKTAGIKQLNRVNRNLAALARMETLTQAARVAAKVKPAQAPAKK